MNVNFEVADVTRPMVAVGEPQRRWMTVTDGLRGRVAKPAGGSLELSAFERHLQNLADSRRQRYEGSGADRGARDTNAGETKVTSELPPVADIIDTTRDDAEAQIKWWCQRRRILALLSVPGTISVTCRSGVGASVAWQDAVQTIITARPTVTQAFRESRAT